jgi:hypothetical protein
MNTSADHEAYLRAALHAAADSLQPRGDGLDRIRLRLQRRPRAVAWLLAAGDALRLRVPVTLEDTFYRLGTGFLAAWQRFSPSTAPGKHRSRAQGWLRPLAGMAMVIFIVAAGTYVAIDVSTAVSPSSQSSHPSNGGQPGPGASHPSLAPTESSSRSAAGSGTPTHHASPTSPAPSSPAPSSPAPTSPAPTSPAPTSPAPTSPAPTSPTPTSTPSG